MKHIFNRIFLISFVLTSINVWSAPNPDDFFKITIKTDNAGTSASNKFRIPTSASMTYNYSVDCDGDGLFEIANATGDYTCDYSTLGGAGTYQIGIYANGNDGLNGFPYIAFNNSGDKLKVLSIDRWGKSEWLNMAGSFWGASNMTVVTPDTPNFDSLTNVAFMFNGAVSANPNVSNWNTSSIINMRGMFQGASSATPNVGNWNTQNVQFMDFMFAGATSSNPDMSNWNIGDVTDMTGMFNIVSLPKSTYDAALENFSSQTVNSGVVFHAGNSQYCAIAEHLSLSNPATNNWTITDNGSSTGCNSVADFQTNWAVGSSGSITIPTLGAGYYYQVDWNNDGDLDDADESIIHTGNATHTFTANTFRIIRIKGDFPRFYSFASTINTQKLVNIMQWGSIKWQSMEKAFKGASNLSVSATDVPDLSLVASLADMFNGATVVNPNVSLWDTSNITTMESMFQSTQSANPDTSAWNTSEVTNMTAMFQNADVANPHVANWDVSKVTHMSHMFKNAINASPNTSLWDTQNVIRMSHMFQGAINANPNTSLWDTSQVEVMEYMFDGASVAVPDTSGWDTSSVESMAYMFRDATFANPNIENWDISAIHATTVINDGLAYAVKGFTGMFNGVNLPTLNYNFLLDYFASQNVHNNLELDGGTSNYCNSNQGRDTLTITDGWVISDAGSVNCSFDAKIKDFVIVVKTDNPGTSTNSQFTLPVISPINSNTSYNISCRDNNAFNAGGQSGSYTCNYGTPGTYRIRVVETNGDGTGFPNIYFNNLGDRLKILDIRQWGSGEWDTITSAFWGTANMLVSAKDKPDLSGVSSLENLFRGATRVNPYTKYWNMSQINNMRRMFAGAENASPDTSSWNTSSVDDMLLMFWHAYSSNPDMSNWGIGDIDTMHNMFVDVTLPIPNYDAALINFESQAHNSNINFNAGTSYYCDGLVAHANLIADGWNISDLGQECTPDQPTIIPLQLSNSNDNTPSVRVSCSEAGNIVKIFFTGNAYNFTQVANHTCTVSGFQNFSFSNPVSDGNFLVQTTETKNGDESLPSQLPLSSTFFIDTSPPADPESIQLFPNPAANGMGVELNLSGIEWGAIVTVTGMTCIPTPASVTGLVDCIGFVGQDGLDGTNNTITITGNGNANTNTSTGLIVDNTAPDAPLVNPVVNTDTVITGTAEIGSEISVTGATCTNAPIVADNNGVWSCNLSSTLTNGTQVSVTATDGVGNESSPTVITVGSNNPPPNPASIVLLPNPAADGTTVELNLTGIELGAVVTVTGMMCSPSPATNTGLVDCTGIVGQNGLDGTNNVISISNNGNTNSNTSTGLIVDNTAPTAPLVNLVLNTDTVITGTAEVGSEIVVTGATCTNSPIIADNNGDWSCNLSVPLNEGTQVSITATDGVGNESVASIVNVTTNADDIFKSGFE